MPHNYDMNPQQYTNQGVFANSTSTGEAIDLGFNCHYVYAKNIGGAGDVYVLFGSTEATTGSYVISTGEEISIPTGPLTRDLSMVRNTTSTDASGVKVLALSG